MERDRRRREVDGCCNTILGWQLSIDDDEDAKDWGPGGLSYGNGKSITLKKILIILEQLYPEQS